MTILHLSIALAMITAFHFAGRWDGTEEAEKINARIARGDKRELTHWWELTVRVVFLLLGLGVMYLIHEWFGTPQWKLFCVAGMAFGAFVPTHRYYVNTRRTKPKREWWYIAPWGNRYDRTVVRVVMLLTVGRTPKPEFFAALKEDFSNCDMARHKSATTIIRACGKKSYRFEAFVLILSTTTYVLA